MKIKMYSKRNVPQEVHFCSLTLHGLLTGTPRRGIASQEGPEVRRASERDRATSRKHFRFL
eukprot:4836667-Pyramimonas_sp.AAC.1